MSAFVSTTRQDDVLIVGVSGEIDLLVVDRLETELSGAMASTDAATMVVDLSQVTFLDSSGISVLLKGRRLADEHGKVYQVTGATAMVREVLEITGVWQYLTDPSR
jgi:anti-anti-sigma factor